MTPLPCPFCGAEPQYSKRKSDFSATHEWHVFFCFCGERTACAWKADQTRSDALMKWNDRASTKSKKATP